VNVARQQVNTVTATNVIKVTGSTQKQSFQPVEKKMCFCSDADLPIPEKMKNDLKAGKNKKKKKTIKITKKLKHRLH